MHHVYLHSEDLDGWLALPNRPLLPIYRDCFAELEGLCVESEGNRHELRIVLNSGKAPAYLEEQARSFGGHFIIACSGAAWRAVGGSTRLFAPPAIDFTRLRGLLGIPNHAVGVVELQLPGRRAEVAVEEGKRWADQDLVLTLFPESEPVRHRWSFRGSMDRLALRSWLIQLIQEHQLSLAVLEPHRDGALDIVPVVDGRMVAKWTLPHLARSMFPHAVLHLTHGGDGTGDLPAMQAEGVTPLSARNCPETRVLAAERGGMLARRIAPEGGAVLECYLGLARRGFYGPLSPAVIEIATRALAGS